MGHVNERRRVMREDGGKGKGLRGAFLLERTRDLVDRDRFSQHRPILFCYGVVLISIHAMVLVAALIRAAEIIGQLRYVKVAIDQGAGVVTAGESWFGSGRAIVGLQSSRDFLFPFFPEKDLLGSVIASAIESNGISEATARISGGFRLHVRGGGRGQWVVSRTGWRRRGVVSRTGRRRRGVIRNRGWGADRTIHRRRWCGPGFACHGRLRSGDGLACGGGLRCARPSRDHEGDNAEKRREYEKPRTCEQSPGLDVCMKCRTWSV